jgi:hypothetical protein
MIKILSLMYCTIWAIIGAKQKPEQYPLHNRCTWSKHENASTWSALLKEF